MWPEAANYSVSHWCRGELATFGQNRAADDGDPDALAKLRHWLDEQPEIWQRVGNLAAHTETVLVDVVAGNDKLVAESIKRQLAEMKFNLGGPDPSPLVKLTVDRIVSCWLQLQYADGQANKVGQPLPHAGYWLRRQATADRMYHTAIKSLALVRKMLPVAESALAPNTLRYPRAGAG